MLLEGVRRNFFFGALAPLGLIYAEVFEMNVEAAPSAEPKSVENAG